MGKIVASYLLKVHLHERDTVEELAGAAGDTFEPPTNESLKASVIDGLSADFGVETTVSLIERTDD